MELYLLRDTFTDKSTLGRLAIDGIFECFTLERSYTDPEYKAIPLGNYLVTLKWSNHFQCITPHLEDVPGRSFIEIHWGNTPQDTDGCVIVGMEKGTNEVFHSQLAFHSFFQKLDKAHPIHITIEENKPNEKIITA